MRGFERLTLPIMLVILAAILVAAIYLELTFHSLVALFAGIGVVAVLAGVFLWDYSQRPMEAPPPAPHAPVGPPEPGAASPIDAGPIDPNEEFFDPVIEADQIASGEVLPDVVEDDSEAPTPKSP